MKNIDNSKQNKIKLQDSVFAPRLETAYRVTIPSCIHCCEKTGQLEAFKLKWDKDSNKSHRPWVFRFWDSDPAKIMEGMAKMLMIYPDATMEKRLNEMVDLVVSAQQPDGYLNTYFTVVEPEKRWCNLANGHELYCAGHLIEAAVAHFEVTGSRKFLDAMCRYADYIASVFGPNPGQKRGYPGHEEIELALIKLYRATDEKRYLKLAKYFIDERGSEPNYFADVEKIINRTLLPHHQAHKPVRLQSEAVGHAVRAVYLYCGMVDVAVETQDSQLMDAAIRLFDNITQKQMYIIGGIGSSCIGEKFTHNYGLPNDTAYAESCAAIGLAFFAKRLLDATRESKYADVLERVLYNNGLSGVSLSGDKFFYANLLEVNDTTYEQGVTMKTRQEWFDCACCPPNYCRFVPQLGEFCYNLSPELLRIDIPAAAIVSTANYEVRIDGGYPYDGTIELTILRGGDFSIAFRIPAWCKEYSFGVNGKPVTGEIEKGYWKVKHNWHPGDRITVSLGIKPTLIYPHPAIVADAGKVAIQYGPVVYCLESVDNPNIPLQNVILPSKPNFKLGKVDGLPEETIAIRCNAKLEFSQDEALYRTTPPQYRDVEVCAIPYALWQNRGESSMQVFMRVSDKI